MKANATTPVPFPGIGNGFPASTEPFFRYRRQQELLVGKMPVERAPGDAQVSPTGPKGQLLDAMCLDDVYGLSPLAVAIGPAVLGSPVLR